MTRRFHRKHNREATVRSSVRKIEIATGISAHGYNYLSVDKISDRTTSVKTCSPR